MGHFTSALTAWLEHTPNVHIWVSILLGKHPEGAIDITSHWHEWASVTRYPFTPEIVLAGRVEAARGIEEWLGGPPSILDVQAETLEEAVAFYAATVQRLPEDSRETTEVRSVVVEESTTWRRLALSERPLVLIPTFSDRSVVPHAVQRGHHVLLPLGLSEAAGNRSIHLDRPRRDAIRSALATMQVPDAGIESLATLGRRSLAALRRRLALNPAILVPQWASPTQARELLPALLIGRWSDTNPGDREILARLAGRGYDEVAATLTRWSNETDPFIRRVGDTWLVVAKGDSWLLLSRFLTHDDLDRFAQAVLDVLGETDPRYELEPERRYAAAVYGKVLPHSGFLREGIAETLALMAARSASCSFSDSASGEEWSERILFRLFAVASTWQHWASLSGVLPLLAEASPSQVLDAVGKIASGDSPVAVDLFRQEDSLFGGSPHTGLLWALERLAWPAEHLPRVALLLAKLAQLDPGGKLANRPAGSLREIFRSWRPCTAATLEQRLKVIDLIRKREPQVAWPLLKGILPERHSVAHPTAKPEWREWVADPVPEVTYGELHRLVKEVLSRILQDAGTATERWCDIIKMTDDLPQDEFEQALGGLATHFAATTSDSEREQLRANLREVISRHAAFPNAAWAMPQERIERLREVYAGFEPSDLVARHAWLFTRTPQVVLPEHTDWHQRRDAVETLRHRAVEEIYNEGGLPRLLGFAAQVDDPGSLGFSLGKSGVVQSEEDEFLSRTLGAVEIRNRDLAFGYIQGRATGDPSWLEAKRSSSLLASSTARAKADFYLCLPFEHRTWELVGEQDEGVQKSYWEDVSYWGRGQLEDVDHQYVVDNLVAHGRLMHAIDFVGLYTRDGTSKVAATTIADLLDRLVEFTHTERVNWQALHYQVTELLDLLGNSDEIEESRVARLEWAFLPLLEDSRYGARVLHRALATDPEFFCEVIQWVFKGRNEETVELSPDEANRARMAWELLHTWRRIPGSDETGGIDGQALTRWVIRARELAQQSDRSEIADQQIGGVLAFSSNGSDDVWPHEAVRDLIDELESEHIDTGICVGVFNRRGVTSRAPADGGDQERDLAARYRAYANAVRDEWPRTAQVLTRIAEDYERQAHREDLSADLQQDLWR